jgi:fatty acid desaturase
MLHYLNASLWLATQLAALVHGFLRAMIITRDTHAASHYAWSYNPTLNQWMYRICMAYAGSSPAQWTSKHVIAHHISTNISPIDDDTMYAPK